MHQITCTCGCNSAIPDLVLTALESQFRYGGARLDVRSCPEPDHHLLRAAARPELRQAA